jgi:hypothetical protein
MPVTAQQLVDEFLGQWNFDVSEAEALTWLDRRHKKMVRRSRCNLKTVAVGTTTAGVSDYAIKAVEIMQVLVDGVPFGKAPRSAQNAYSRGRLVWTPADEGLFVSTANGSGVSEVGLIPPPTQTGLAIQAFAAMPATDLVLASTLLVDDDYHEVLQEGMAATGYARDVEQLPSADRCEARFDAGCEEYRREIKRRMRSGPAQIRVRGVNA